MIVLEVAQIIIVLNYCFSGAPILHAESECTPGDVRLVGGETRADGQVQICYNGQWGSIASDGWESVDAQVVCRQLGFPDISE